MLALIISLFLLLSGHPSAETSRKLGDSTWISCSIASGTRTLCTAEMAENRLSSTVLATPTLPLLKQLCVATQYLLRCQPFTLTLDIQQMDREGTESRASTLSLWGTGRYLREVQPSRHTHMVLPSLLQEKGLRFAKVLLLEHCSGEWKPCWEARSLQH